MGATMTTVSALTKEIYEGTLRLQLNDEMTTLKRVTRTSDGVTSEVGGKYVTFPIHVTRNPGIGARLEMEQLPTAGNQGTLAARVLLKYLYGAVRLSGQTLKLASKNPQAFVSALDLEMQGLKRDLGVDFNRQVYGNGTGAIATITTVVTSTTFVVKWNGALQMGAIVDVYDSTGVTQKATGRTITAITGTTGVTISGANITTAVGDIIVRTGSVGLATLVTQREITGFGAILQSSGALYNVTDSQWTANIDANGGTNRPLSEGLMINMVDTIRSRGGLVTALFTNLGVRRAYFNLLSQQRRFTNSQKFDGGFSGLAFTTDQGDIPMVVDTLCPPNSLKFINEGELKIYQEEDWSFMDEDGSMWIRVTGFDAYDATMFKYCELGTHRRNTHGDLQDLTEG
jgi:hypothetical protein